MCPYQMIGGYGKNARRQYRTVFEPSGQAMCIDPKDASMIEEMILEPIMKGFSSRNGQSIDFHELKAVMPEDVLDLEKMIGEFGPCSLLVITKKNIQPNAKAPYEAMALTEYGQMQPEGIISCINHAIRKDRKQLYSGKGEPTHLWTVGKAYKDNSALLFLHYCTGMPDEPENHDTLNHRGEKLEHHVYIFS